MKLSFRFLLILHTIFFCTASYGNTFLSEAEKYAVRVKSSISYPFDWIKEQTAGGSAVPDALIYMTDGYGSEPKELPNHECLWVVPEGGSKEFDYGQVIEISKA